MVRRFGWPRPVAVMRTSSCTRMSATTVGWTFATPSNISERDGKSRCGSSTRSKRWFKRKERLMNSSRLQNQWQQLPEAEIRRLQAEKLRHYLRTVVIPFSPHYRELFREQNLDAGKFRTLDDLQLLPFTQKSNLL